MKIYNLLNGIFYVLFGLFGVFLPLKMGAFMGWELSLLGLHEMRAVCMVMAALGAMSILYANKLPDQKPLTLAIIFVTLSFMAGRLLGVVLDGSGPMQTWHEVGIEVVWSGLGAFLLSRANK